MFEGIARFMARAAGGSFVQKENPVGPLIGRTLAKRPQFMNWSYKTLSEEGYAKCGTVFMCIDLVAKCMSNVPLRLMQGNSPVKDKKHPLVVLLNRPNPWECGTEFWANAIRFWLGWGNSYIIPNTAKGMGMDSGAPPPQELWRLRPDRMKIIPGDLGGPGAYEFMVNGQKTEFKVDEINGTTPILHMKTFNPMDDFYGLPPMRVAAMQVDQSNSGAEWNMNVLQNSGRSSGAFVYAPDGNPGAQMSTAQKQKLQEDMRNNLLGPRNARLPMLLDGGLDWKEMAMTAQEMDWLEGIQAADRAICRVFGVPSQLLNIPGDNTYSNYEQARLALYEETVMPNLDLWLDALNSWLVPCYGNNLSLVMDEDKISALAPRRKEKFDMLSESTWMTINEKREAMNLEPIPEPEADEIWVPTTMQPLSMAVEPPDEMQGLDENGDPLPAAKPNPGSKAPPKTNGKKPPVSKSFDEHSVDLIANLNRLKDFIP
jgi:HK97 family phage portal protein